MIDVTKCLGCRKGIDIWDKQEGKIKHVDLFASAEAGAIQLQVLKNICL